MTDTNDDVEKDFEQVEREELPVGDKVEEEKKDEESVNDEMSPSSLAKNRFRRASSRFKRKSPARKQNISKDISTHLLSGTALEVEKKNETTAVALVREASRSFSRSQESMSYLVDSAGTAVKDANKAVSRDVNAAVASADAALKSIADSTSRVSSPVYELANDAAREVAKSPVRMIDMANAALQGLHGSVKQIEDVILPDIEAPSTAPPTNAYPPNPENEMKELPASSAASVGSGSAGSRQGMDLSNNDNAFHVIANLVLDRFKNGKTYLTAEDHLQLDKTVPPSVRASFVEAVRYRLKHKCPPDSKASIHSMTRRCGELGLDKVGSANPLFALPKEETPTPVPAPAPPITGATKDSATAAKAGLFRGLGGVFGQKKPEPEHTRSAFPPAHPPRPASAVPTSIPMMKTGDEGSVLTSSMTGPDGMHVANTESLARQQLMAELREASNLMASSVTPEAAQFWRNHVVDLQARLRALHGESSGAELEHKLSQFNEANKKLVAQYENMSFPSGPPVSLDNNKRQVHIAQPPPPSSAAVAAQGASSYMPPSVPSVDANSVTQSVTFRAEDPDGDFSATRNERGQHARTREMPPTVVASPAPEVPITGLPMVDVVAPADLPGGYHFEAEIDGRRFLATVPEGGVRKGQAFSCLMRDLENPGSDTPVGRWRDELWDLGANGATHPVMWNSLVCPMLGLGQVMTRLNFDFRGQPMEVRGRNSAYNIMWLIIAFWFVMNFAIIVAIQYKWSKGIDMSIADYAAIVLVNASAFSFAVLATMKTRQAVREKYMIKEEPKCGKHEDLIVSTFCMPCVVAQMSRHTADYSIIDAQCCTDSGLPPETDLHAPVSHKAGTVSTFV